MKICAVISEYNPFHNGHAHQLAEIRRESGCDKILCLMSGNFTQRGEAAVFGKYERARHAIEGGADAVLELPAAFAACPAELFARGAVHILAAIPAVEKLAFGCESGTKEDFLRAAEATLREDKAFKTALKENMKDGTSYAKARTETVLSLHADVDEALLTSPNNLLGTEYCRALKTENSKIEPLPLKRIGGGYADTSVLENFSSATALRAVLKEDSRKAKKALKNNLPPSVCRAALSRRPVAYETAALAAFLRADDHEISRAPDCSEGIENRIRAMLRSNPDYSEMLQKVVTKRYTASHVRRLILQVFLGVRQSDVESFLSSPLYLRTLALRKEGAEELLKALSLSSFPVVARKSDYSLLKKDALSCFSLDVRANELYNVLSGVHSGEYETLFV